MKTISARTASLLLLAVAITFGVTKLAAKEGPNRNSVSVSLACYDGPSYTYFCFATPANTSQYTYTWSVSGLQFSNGNNFNTDTQGATCASELYGTFSVIVTDNATGMSGHASTDVDCQGSPNNGGGGGGGNGGGGNGQGPIF